MRHHSQAYEVLWCERPFSHFVRLGIKHIQSISLTLMLSYLIVGALHAGFHSVHLTVQRVLPSNWFNAPCPIGFVSVGFILSTERSSNVYW